VEYFRLRKNIDSGVRIVVVVCHPTENKKKRENSLAKIKVKKVLSVLYIPELND
jgi:hypothetical protein